MIVLDEAELEGLVDFLRDCPGRISAAVVPGQETGNALLERVRGALPGLTFEVVNDSATPGEIGRRSEELGHSDSNVLVLRLDRRRRHDSDEDEDGFWRGLNYQRERLASGEVRSCLFVDDAGNDRLALLADDLYEWVAFFRFPTLAPRTGFLMSGSRVQMPERWADGVAEDLDVLRDQWRRAREAGLPEQELVWDYTRPLFAALVKDRLLDEARRFWKYELRNGDALATLADERRLQLVLDAYELARHEDLDQSRSLALDYVTTAERVLQKWRGKVSDDSPVTTLRDIAQTFFDRGYVLRNLGEREAARESFEQALAVCRNLASQSSANFEPELATTLYQLGSAQRELGESNAAEESFREALKIYRRLVKQHPSASQSDLAMILHNFGTLQRELGEHGGAQESLQEALKIYQRLANQHLTAFQPYVAMTLNNLGNVQRELGEHERALESLQEALEIYRSLAVRNHATFEPYVAVTLTNLGLLLGDLERLEAARECFVEALGIYSRLAETDPQAFVDYLLIVLQGYTSVTPESAHDLWWQLWKKLTREAQDEATAEEVRSQE